VPQPPRRLPALANTAPVWRRSWIAVARAADVPDNTPVQVLLAGDAWVLTRMDGVLTAFDDHCPHQQSPLSAGSVSRAEDGSARLLCAFHGWRFDPAGQCDLMPEEDRGHGGGHHHHHRWHGKRAGHHRQGDRGPHALGTSLRAAHGVVERYGLIWLAADEPRAPLPEFPEWEDGAAGRAAGQGVTVRASAGQVIDGFLGRAAGAEAGAVTADEWRVTGTFVRADRAGLVIKTAGPHASAHVRLELAAATIGMLVSCQPEDWGTTRVYQLIAHSGLASGTAAMAEFARDEARALAADLAAAEGLAAAAGPLGPGREVPGGQPAGPRASQLSVAWRRLMAKAAGLPPG